MKKVIFIIVCIFVVIVVAGLLAGLITQTKGFTTNFQVFYINVNGERIIEKASGYRVDHITPLDVQVRYVFGEFLKEEREYSVEVLPSNDISFNFTVDGLEHSFEQETDLSSGFRIDFGEGGFTIRSKGYVRQILSCVYPERTVAVSEDMAHSEDKLFKLVVTSYNGKDSVEITFGVSSDIAVEGVMFPDGGIVL